MSLFSALGYVYYIVKCLLCVLNVNVLTACLLHVFMGFIYMYHWTHINCTGLRTLWWDSSLDTLTEMNLRYSLMETGLQSINNNKQTNKQTKIIIHTFYQFSFAYIVPSVTVQGYNPAFRIYTLDGDYKGTSSVCVCMHVCVHACVCACMCVCMCVCEHVHSLM